MRRQFRWDRVIMALVAMCVVCSPAMADEPALFDVIKRPAYAGALKTLLGHAGKLPDWVGEVLKPKGALFQEGTVSYLGAPSEAQQKVLKEWLDAREDYNLSGVLKNPDYERALKSLFDRAGNLPRWTQEVFKPQGYIVENLVSRVNADRTTYEVFTECMPHDSCEGNALVLMFAPDGTQAWGALFQEGTISYLGAPSDAQRAALSQVLRVNPHTLFSYLIKKPAYARALKSLFDHTANLPSWTQETLKPKGFFVEKSDDSDHIGTTVYTTLTECMPYHCHDSELALMFAPNGTRAWGALVNRWPLSYVYLGAPSEAQQAILKKALE
jgi:hypothetical protein